MFRPVSSRVSFPALEAEILAFWKEGDIFKRSVEQRADRRQFVFYEGPPTANGKPGIHHVLARVFKDIILRHRTMKGYYVPRKAGWDTHGLPVELEIERELGLSSKTEIEQYGIAAFNQRCRESVFRYLQDWKRLTERIAFWLDLDDAYVTYTNDYIESCWWIVKELWDKGLVYQGYRVTPHCPRCGTSLSSHEVALGYKEDTDDPSVYVKFELTDADAHLTANLTTYLLAWTTTPWTLPGNMALAVNAYAEYAIVEVEVPGPRGGTERMILARDLLDQVLVGDYQFVGTLAGRDLVARHYKPLYQLTSFSGDAHRVLAGDFVSLEDGTGIVHIAPAFGEVDLELARANNLPIVHTVDLRGRIIPAPVPFAGMFAKDADPLISDDLARRGLLYRSERIKHTYPFCWRCDSPLLYYAKTSWYFKTTAVKEALIAGNDKVNWYPEHIKHGRFGDWLENNVDWAFSRERYWGTPLPIWRCEACGRQECIGSVAELKRRATTQIPEDFDLHRPYIDDVSFNCPLCRGPMRRVPEVVDAWFDSGAMPVAQWHYPLENQERFEKNFPADFICEAIDQTRGWFYSLHAESVMLFGEPSYRNVLCLGHILDEKGEKMSKHRGNVVDPWTVLDNQGCDALRWYLFTASPPGNARRFSQDLVAEGLRKFLLTLWNTYSFFVTYANIDRFVPATSPLTRDVLATDPLDRWVLSELQALISAVDEGLEQFDPTTAGRAIQAFIDDLSNWYVRRSRRRFWKSENDADKLAAHQTLYESLVTIAKLLAPFAPFVSEAVYQNLVGTVRPGAVPSVHLADFPVANPDLVDEALMRNTRLVMRLASLGRAARSKAAARVRQPLAEALVKVRAAEERDALRALAPQLLEELNVKKLTFLDDESVVAEVAVKPKAQLLGRKYGRQLQSIAAALATVDAAFVARKVRRGEAVAVAGVELLAEELEVVIKDKPGYATAVDGEYLMAVTTNITAELAQEGAARELVHRIQTMRKNGDFQIEEHVATHYQAGPKVTAIFERFGEYIKQETLSHSLVPSPGPPGAYHESFNLEGDSVEISLAKKASS